MLITLILLIVAATAYKVWKINKRVRQSDIYRAFARFDDAVKKASAKRKA